MGDQRPLTQRMPQGNGDIEPEEDEMPLLCVCRRLGGRRKVYGSERQPSDRAVVLKRQPLDPYVLQDRQDQ